MGLQLKASYGSSPPCTIVRAHTFFPLSLSPLFSPFPRVSFSFSVLFFFIFRSCLCSFSLSSSLARLCVLACLPAQALWLRLSVFVSLARLDSCFLVHCDTHRNTHCNMHCNTYCNALQYTLQHTLQHTQQHAVQHTAQCTLQHTHTLIHTAAHPATHTAAHTATRTATRTAKHTAPCSGSCPLILSLAFLHVCSLLSLMRVRARTLTRSCLLFFALARSFSF